MSANEYMLSRGSHPTPDAGRCAMEWVAYLAGEPHSDKPACVSPLLRRFGIALNDSLPNEKRQAMRPYLARMIGTADDGLDPERAMLAVDWLVRVYTPSWLDLVPSRADDAAALRALPPVLQVETVERAMTVIVPAQSRARVARNALRYADARAARDATWDVTQGATLAALIAARDVALNAALIAAAARDVALNAALIAAAAAGRDVLQPTVELLQHSAVHGLLASMLPTEAAQLPAVGAIEAERVCEVPA